MLKNEKTNNQDNSIDLTKRVQILEENNKKLAKEKDIISEKHNEGQK